MGWLQLLPNYYKLHGYGMAVWPSPLVFRRRSSGRSFWPPRGFSPVGVFIETKLSSSRGARIGEDI